MGDLGEVWEVWGVSEVSEVQDSKNIGWQIFSDDKELALRLYRDKLLTSVKPYYPLVSDHCFVAQIAHTDQRSISPGGVGELH